MNTAETNVDTDLFSGLAPITRIGGGEVRVDQALTSRAAAWDEDTKQGALSFGFIDVYRTTHTLFKRIRTRNYSDEAITCKIIPTFRYEDDEASGAVSVAPVFPGQVRVGPHGDRTVSVAMTIIGDRLPNNFMNSGSHGNDGSVLTMNEYDGYLILDDGVQPIHLAWHVLPRKASNLVVASDQLDFNGSNQTTIDMLNSGMGVAQIDSFSLLALSPNIPEGEIGAENPTPDIRAVGVSTLEVGPGVCGDEASFIWKFAITTWERQQHLFPVRHWVYLDIDQDDEFDYAILNDDLLGFGPYDGRQLALSFDLKNGTEDAAFFAEHSTNTGNTVLAVCADQVGLSLADLRSTNVDVAVEVQSKLFDIYSDSVEGITVTPGAERYVAPPGDLGSGESGPLTVTDTGAFEGNSPELGLMVFSNSDRGEGNRGGATQETELIVLRA